MRRRHWLMMQNWAKVAGFAGFIMAILGCAFIWTISYPPLPGFGRDGEHYDCRSEAEHNSRQNTAPDGVIIPPLGHTDQRSSEASKACREERERLQKAANERGVTIATWVLAFSTVALVGAVGVQAFLFILQLKIMNIGVQDAKVAAEAARDAAAAANLSAKAAVALELPILRAVPSDPIGMRVQGDMEAIHLINVSGPLPEQWILEGITVSNLGRTAATPVAVKLGWRVTNRLDGEPHYPIMQTANADSIIRAGAKVSNPINLTIMLTEEQFALVDGQKGDFFWLYASLEYIDFLDERHEVRFCWMRDMPSQGRVCRWSSPPGIPSAYTMKKKHG